MLIMIGEVDKPKGALVLRDGTWFKYGHSRYALYNKNGEWRESAKITNENLADWLIGKEVQSEKAPEYYYSGSAGVGITTPPVPVAVGILTECAKIQADRGAEYDKANQAERSSTRVAQAFNAITGKDLTPAEVCLLLQVLKDVRQWSNPNRLHKDSAIDGVNYSALKVEELFNQFGETL